MQKQRVLIVGYGEMGHAMQHLLQPYHDVTIWQRRPADGEAVALTQAAADKDALIVCIPTGPVCRVLTELTSVLQPATLVISIAKGLDDKGRPAFDAISEALNSSSPRVVQYGPMISEEIRADRPGVRHRALPAGTPERPCFRSADWLSSRRLAAMSRRRPAQTKG
jgi:glycerol-3-phosphate dehydrogenase (NAD(P)+)